MEAACNGKMKPMFFTAADMLISVRLGLNVLNIWGFWVRFGLEITAFLLVFAVIAFFRQ